MHLFLMSSGEMFFQKRFFDNLNSMHVPFNWTDPKTLQKMTSIQVVVRPVQFHQIVFPETAKDIVLTTCLGGKDSKKGEPNISGHQKWMWALRKALGPNVKPIPEYNTDRMLPVNREHMELLGIGIKEDRKEEFTHTKGDGTVTKWHNEML